MWAQTARRTTTPPVHDSTLFRGEESGFVQEAEDPKQLGTTRAAGSTIPGRRDAGTRGTDDRITAVRIEEIMRNRLADRVYPANARIPTLPGLAAEFGVSVTTVRAGLAPLITQGLLFVSDRRRDGTLVSHLASELSRDDVLRMTGRTGPGETPYPAWGETMRLVDWSRDPRCLVSYSTLVARVREYGWELQRALTTPPGGSTKLQQHRPNSG
ncbi:GntR family transcriptional regulator [Streptomyces sp. NBC_00370]|uniref:GntR family transcriptional regulator n=1 Tax=Streptomyces sp. NBC_00370 TaxID=2975728 RepID=UPI002E2646C8